MKTLVLFDFDGTITRGDSMWSFLRYFSGNVSFFLRTLQASPWLVLYALGLLSTQRAKEKLLSVFLKGKTAAELEQGAMRFTADRLPQLMNTGVVQKLNEHRSNGHRICVVTASCSLWVRPFCEGIKADLIATELDFTNGVFNGNFKTPNCKGQEKVIRIRSTFDLASFSKIIAYGNAGPDDEMLALADVKNVV